MLSANTHVQAIMLFFKSSFIVVAVLSGIATGGPALRIINGIEVSIDEVPFMASVCTATDGQHCGGAILTSYYVMTAAPCVRDNLQVRVGTHLRSSGGSLFDVITVTTHPDYSSNVGPNLAILGLSQPIVFDNFYVTQAPLPFQDMPVLEGVFGFVAGWGHTELNGSPSEELRLGQVAITSQDACTAVHQNPLLEESVICASSANVDVCHGDVGGPLISSGLVTGVTFQGFCGIEDVPILCTNVAKYSDWIVSVATGTPEGVNAISRNSNGLNLEVLRS